MEYDVRDKVEILTSGGGRNFWRGVREPPEPPPPPGYGPAVRQVVLVWLAVRFLYLAIFHRHCPEGDRVMQMASLLTTISVRSKTTTK